MQTADGRSLALSSLCEKQLGDSSIRSVHSSPSPYNATAIKKLDDELYRKSTDN